MFVTHELIRRSGVWLSTRRVFGQAHAARAVKQSEGCPSNGANAARTSRFERSLRRPPRGRRAVISRPQAAQGEGSAPALTDPVTVQAGASPNERQRKERPQTRLMRCLVKREARTTGGLGYD